jgi:hypothetical protein
MDIIKRGTPPGERIYTGSCRGCGTEVKFKRDEAEVYSDQRDGETVSVACPVCHAIIYGTEQKLFVRNTGSQWEDR